MRLSTKPGLGPAKSRDEVGAALEIITKLCAKSLPKFAILC
ncbi:hypothetical protein [Oceanisphaera ostreae]|uniref:Uncharacterized protein n=1 Tax=Oceanisphaera ostreae TaxID=914151 RepID=A0ABW3KD54_9GAMM